MKRLIITGIRGIPASHGGFETFAENLALYLVDKGWQVTVYCQESKAERDGVSESNWRGIRRIHIPVASEGAKATVLFDFLSVKHAMTQQGLILTLGYNTALFNLGFRIKGRYNLINMDGIEWKRDKWTWYEKAWLYFNERAGCLIGNHLIADHPEIKNHLVTRVDDDNVTMIPYGARRVSDADVSLLTRYDIQPKNYAIVIARPEPENSILEIVQAFSQKKRYHQLVVLGKYDPSNPYHALVMSVASDEVKFIGAIYDHDVLDALRFYASCYVHGHTVGGTNPSLIEALGAAQAVIANDNRFNRWVAGEEAEYFDNEQDLSELLDRLLIDTNKLEYMSQASLHRYEALFTWQLILEQYEQLLLKWIKPERY
jgi:glycosyltransferase involved in cell wall biosynthesis